MKQEELHKQFKCEVLDDIANLMRIECIEMTDKSGSGHPTSCSSIGEIMSCLFFSEWGMKINYLNPGEYCNERLVLSKGHAAPILYSCWKQAGFLSKDQIMTLREIGSDIEGHPMPNMPFVDVATGSLGQGLGVACGIAYANKYLDLNAQGDKHNNNQLTYCIMGDGELAEGSVFEAANFASFYSLDNLVAIVDVNKLGQSTTLGDKSSSIQNKFQAFGWATHVIDGHSSLQIASTLKTIRLNLQNTKLKTKSLPTILICNTIKGKNMGATVEDNQDYHGKPLGSESANAIQLLKSLIKNANVKGELNLTSEYNNKYSDFKSNKIVKYDVKNSIFGSCNKNVATRQAYGVSLAKMGEESIDSRQQIVVCDADVKNSTFSIEFMKSHKERFVECFIAEQNMVSVALGLQARGKVVFISTFAAFLSRGFDQIRMGGVSQSNLKICGSHVGCSIGEDGTSQMGLEDIAIMRSIPNSVVLYPSDKFAMEQALYLAANHKGIFYIRSTRGAHPQLYTSNTHFQIGQAQLLKSSDTDVCLLVAAGATLFEALQAHHTLQQSNINVSLIDIFSVKPIDTQALILNAANSNNTIIVIEDHYPQGGIYEAVCSALSEHPGIKVIGMAVNQIPKSGKPQELVQFCGISHQHIVAKVQSLLK